VLNQFGDTGAPFALGVGLLGMFGGGYLAYRRATDDDADTTDE
jgi:hypothetical protein